MGNILAICHELNIRKTESNRSVLINIVSEFEEELNKLSLGVSVSQEQLISFIRNHSSYNALELKSHPNPAEQELEDFELSVGFPTGG